MIQYTKQHEEGRAAIVKELRKLLKFHTEDGMSRELKDIIIKLTKVIQGGDDEIMELHGLISKYYTSERDTKKEKITIFVPTSLHNKLNSIREFTDIPFSVLCKISLELLINKIWAKHNIDVLELVGEVLNITNQNRSERELILEQLEEMTNQDIDKIMDEEYRKIMSKR